MLSESLNRLAAAGIILGLIIGLSTLVRPVEEAALSASISSLNLTSDSDEESEHAFHDQAMQVKLIDIGPLVLARLGQTLALETATLRVRARVVEMTYKITEKFDNRFFKELTVELAAWQRRQNTL
jgi:hypothetical protein